jgi:acyl-CoA synthetase
VGNERNTLLTRLSTTTSQHFRAAGLWRDDTIYSLVRSHAQLAPDKVAIRERARAVTYGELVDAADRFASAVHSCGARRGERIAVWLSSRIEVAVVLLACSRNGYVCCPSLHRDHTVGEVVELVGQMRAVALVAEEGHGADADRHDVFHAASQLEHVRLVVRSAPASEGGPAFGDVAAPREHVDARGDADAVVYLAFTSGTTGTPKGVMHSANTLLAPVRAMARDWSLDDKMVVYSFSPLSHNLGFGAMVLALTGGGELVVHDRARGESAAQRLADTKATFVFGVPTHAIDLLAELDERPSLDLSTLQGFRVSGAPVPPAVAQRLLDHGIVAQSGYGMTEGGSHHYTRPNDTPALVVETSGRPCDGHEARIFARDDPDKELPAGEIGEIAGRGASIMLGYFDDQASTEQSFNASGWFMSGDLGWVDEAGYLRVTGRKKDVIIRGGHKIFPARIEQLAMTHPGVAHAAVLPVADERLGEKVCLVVSTSGARVAADDVLRHLDSAGLSKYDMPEYFAAVDAIPRLPSGKLAKRDLASWIEQGRVVPSPVRFERR